jgi:hypothetical protein
MKFHMIYVFTVKNREITLCLREHHNLNDFMNKLLFDRNIR